MATPITTIASQARALPAPQSRQVAQRCSVRSRPTSTPAFVRAQPMRTSPIVRSSVAESEIQLTDPATELEAPAPAPVAEAAVAVPAGDVAAVASDATAAADTPVQERERGRGQGGRGAGRGRGGRGGGRPPRVFTVQLEDLVVGQELAGTVKSVQAYGAFVDVGARTDGLCHISQLSSEFVKDPNDIVKAGEKVTVRVLSIDMSANKISLTMRDANEPAREVREPRDAAAPGTEGDRSGGAAGRQGRDRLGKIATRGGGGGGNSRPAPTVKRGDMVTGTVVSVLGFGAFIKLPDGTQALLHVSEMRAPEGTVSPQSRDLVKLEEELEVRVLDVNGSKVNVTQKTEEEARQEKQMSGEGFGTNTSMSGVTNTLQAALARAGIKREAFATEAEEAVQAKAKADQDAADEAVAAAKAEADQLVADEAAAVVKAEADKVAAEEAAVAAAQAEADEQAAAVVKAEADKQAAEEAAIASAKAEADEQAAAEAATVAKAEADKVAAEEAAVAAAKAEADEQAAAEAATAAKAEADKQAADEAATAAAAADAKAEADKQAAAAAVPAPVAEAVSAVEPAAAAPSATAGISAALVKQLRDKSGAGMMQCKKALGETGGDLEKAVEYLRVKGLAQADKKAGRTATEGLVTSYIHAGARLGVLVEVNCETDFVAKGDIFKELVSDIAMQIAASAEATFVSTEDVPADFVAKETAIEMEKEDILSKPEAIRSKIVEGRVAKTVNTRALLEQPFIKDTGKTVGEHIKQTISAIGENIKIRRFERFVLGEGLEKRSSDLAAEVAEQREAFEQAAAEKAAAAAAAPAVVEEEKAADAEAKPVVQVSAKVVKQLRDKSGAGMMDCKKALAECDGDVEAAADYLRKKGLISAGKKAGRVASDGAVGAYIHAGSRLGVLVEVNCETDFVARGDIFRELVTDLAMQVAASGNAEVVSLEDVSQEMLERERKIELQKEDLQSKPLAIREKMVEGRLGKIAKELALLEQPFIKDNTVTVGEHIKAAVAAIGENIQVRRFTRYNLGEGMEKKTNDFAAEVAQATGQV